MRLLILHSQPSGVVWYRFDTPAAALRKLDIEVDVMKLNLKDVEQYILGTDTHYDLIHANYCADQAAVSLLAGAREYLGIPIITDIDDDILNVPQYNLAFNHFHGGTQGRRIARMQLRVSDAVSMSTPPLVTALGPECRDYELLPNCINMADWRGLPQDTDKEVGHEIRVMFAGNVGRYGDLEEIRPAIEAAMAKYPNMRLFFMACCPDWVKQWMPSATDPEANRCFYIRYCDRDRYPAILHYLQPDIMIAPVVENAFNASKSHIKAYDAAMTGAAFLCSDFATYEAVPSTAAVKVKGNYEWVEALDQLVSDAELRGKLSGRLREWASEWDIDKHAHKWVNFYTKVCNAGPVRELDDIVRPAAGR